MYTISTWVIEGDLSWRIGDFRVGIPHYRRAELCTCQRVAIFRHRMAITETTKGKGKYGSEPHPHKGYYPWPGFDL
jgi:hypothetical protein